MICGRERNTRLPQRDACNVQCVLQIQMIFRSFLEL
jgi:hypothetical protein